MPPSAFEIFDAVVGPTITEGSLSKLGPEWWGSDLRHSKLFGPGSLMARRGSSNTEDTGSNLLQAEHFLAAIVQTSGDPIIGKTLDGKVAFWNDAAERLYGYSAAEMIGTDISILFPPERRQELPDLLARVRRGEVIRDFETERVRKDGSFVAVSVCMTPVTDAAGEILGISVIAHDLTLLNLQIADLRAAHRMANETLSTLETLHRSAPVGLGFIDREGNLVHVNSELAGVIGTSTDSLIGKPVADIVPEYWSTIEPIFNSVLTRDEAMLNVEVARDTANAPGVTRHWLASFYPVHLEADVIGVGVILFDVTERQRSESFRSNVMNDMDEGLITVDRDGRMTSMNASAFKMLGWTEEELRGQVLSEVILPRRDDGSLDETAQQLLRVRAEGVHVRLNDTEYMRKNGTKIAVALSASPLLNGSSIEGAVVVFRDITEESAERLRVSRELAALAWVGRIRDALDEDRFVLYSQPIVPLKDDRPSEELLLRMLGKGGDVIPPLDFLGVAERYSLINEIDRWVVSQAVLVAASGRHVGVNLSAESIMSLDMLAYIEGLVASSGADPTNLMFEITETSFMRDIERGYAFSKGVSDLGCSIALDDFGTGFGTFTHVKRLTVKYLKIDIEFVRGLANSIENQHVVRAIVNLAKGFGCQTIAEGVEDGDTLALLGEYDVDFAQGFFLGRPAPLH